MLTLPQEAIERTKLGKTENKPRHEATVMKELSEKSYIWITSTANHEFAILLT
jgi:hypothetical protein